jgi:hypothetical protein
MFKVFKKPCKNCLFSDAKLVSNERAEELKQQCVEENTFFECHAATLNDNSDSVCCHNFYKQLGKETAIIRIAEALKVVEFVELPDIDYGLSAWKDEE